MLNFVAYLQALSLAQDMQQAGGPSSRSNMPGRAPCDGTGPQQIGERTYASMIQAGGGCRLITGFTGSLDRRALKRGGYPLEANGRRGHRGHHRSVQVPGDFTWEDSACRNKPGA